MSTLPLQISTRYKNEIVDSHSAWHDWRTNTLWTPRATLALRRTGLQLFNTCEAATKNQRDSAGQAEYLNLDVCLWDKDRPWGAPTFIAEHECKGSVDELKYSAWKLLVVQSTVRVLVSYFGRETPFASHSALVDAVLEVCQANPDRAVILISADTRDAMSNDDVLAQHAEAVSIVG